LTGQISRDFECVAEDNDDDDGEWHWPIGRLLSAWRKRRPRQLRDVLPGNFSAPRLRIIRANACEQMARKEGDLIDCAKWLLLPTAPDPSVQIASPVVQRKASMRTGAYVCDGCKHPKVTNSDLFWRLGLTRDNDNFSERTWRRYINDAKPMPITQFRSVVSNAFANGWLGLWQSLAIWQQIDKIHATQSGFRVLMHRVSDRKAFQSGTFDATPPKLKDEISKQLGLIDHAATSALIARLQDVDLAPETRAFLSELLENILAVKPKKD
jgi:hypothetical protein